MENNNNSNNKPFYQSSNMPITNSWCLPDIHLVKREQIQGKKKKKTCITSAEEEQEIISVLIYTS